MTTTDATTSTSDGSEPRAGGRPRDPRLDEAIILATRARLVRDGYSRMTLGDIAAEAGVSRPTLYRRWANKLDLVADALDYGFRRQRDLYDIDISRLEPREALVEAVRRLDPAYFNPDAMVLMGNFAGEVSHTPELFEMLRNTQSNHASRSSKVCCHSYKNAGPSPETSTGTPSPPCASEATSARSTEATRGTRSPRASSPSCGPRSPPD